MYHIPIQVPSVTKREPLISMSSVRSSKTQEAGLVTALHNVVHHRGTHLGVSLLRVVPLGQGRDLLCTP